MLLAITLEVDNTTDADDTVDIAEGDDGDSVAAELVSEVTAEVEVNTDVEDTTDRAVDDGVVDSVEDITDEV